MCDIIKRCLKNPRSLVPLSLFEQIARKVYRERRGIPSDVSAFRYKREAATPPATTRPKTTCKAAARSMSPRVSRAFPGLRQPNGQGHCDAPTNGRGQRYPRPRPGLSAGWGMGGGAKLLPGVRCLKWGLITPATGKKSCNVARTPPHRSIRLSSLTGCLMATPAWTLLLSGRSKKRNYCADLL